MTAAIISFFWAVIPVRWAYAIWRWRVRGSVVGEHWTLQSTNGAPDLPLVGRGVHWGVGEAEAFARFLREVREGTSDLRIERVLRLVEIRKKRFFCKMPCGPALILARSFVESGVRWNDLRFVNTALKLRDLAVTNYPPLHARDRAVFAAVDQSVRTFLDDISSQ